MTVILEPEQRWECPNCTATDVTHESRVHTRMHDCRGLLGLSAPMVPAGTDCKVEAIEREDYIGHDNVSPIMAVRTERADGSNDVHVFAPTAIARFQ